MNRMGQLSGKDYSGLAPSDGNFSGYSQRIDPKNSDIDRNEEKNSFTDTSRNFRGELEKMILQKSKKYNVSPDLISAVIQTESAGKQNSVSQAGAIGLMQIMPKTASELGINPHSPEENLDGGVRYLKEMAGKFNSLDEVLAAYNAGPGAVKKYGGVPPFAETQDYVKKIRKILEK